MFLSKLKGVISKKTAIFKNKKISKNRYVTLKIGDIFTPHFKEDKRSLRAETNCLQFYTCSLIRTEATRFL
jgi:hypothetical protein